jgi:hypothetical protein
MINGLF